MVQRKAEKVHEVVLEGTADKLLPLVYHELRSLANRWLRCQESGQTLQPTTLVHEAYLRLANRGVYRWRNRAHFFATATQAMRQVLIDHVRYRRAGKRGGAWRQTAAVRGAAQVRPHN